MIAVPPSPTAAPGAAPQVPQAAAVHPSMPIPFEVLIQSRRLQGTELSVVSGKASGPLEPSMDGQRDVALLQFNFEGFAVTLEADVSLRVVETDGAHGLEFTFLDPAGPHLPQLRHILNAYIAGDLINLGTVLQPAADARNAPTAKTHASVIQRIVGGATRGLVTACLTIGLVWVALALVESRVLTVTEARPAIVTLPGEVMRAPTAGQIEYLNAAAGTGEVAFSILSNAGIVLSLKMPCDCDVADVATFEGATVLAGEPVLQLADAGSAPVIRAQLGEESLAAIVAGYDIELRGPDGQAVTARLGENAARELTAAQVSDGAVTVTLTPDTPLPATAAGSLMSLRLMRPLPLAGLRLSTLNDRLASLWRTPDDDSAPVQVAARQ